MNFTKRSEHPVLDFTSNIRPNWVECLFNFSTALAVDRIGVFSKRRNHGTEPALSVHQHGHGWAESATESAEVESPFLRARNAVPHLPPSLKHHVLRHSDLHHTRDQPHGADAQQETVTPADSVAGDTQRHPSPPRPDSTEKVITTNAGDEPRSAPLPSRLLVVCNCDKQLLNHGSLNSSIIIMHDSHSGILCPQIRG